MGYAVHAASVRLRLNRTIVSLYPRICDAHDARVADLSRMLTVHKLEPDDAVLRRNEAYEDEETVRRAALRGANASTPARAEPSAPRPAPASLRGMAPPACQGSPSAARSPAPPRQVQETRRADRPAQA